MTIYPKTTELGILCGITKARCNFLRCRLCNGVTHSTCWEKLNPGRVRDGISFRKLLEKHFKSNSFICTSCTNFPQSGLGPEFLGSISWSVLPFPSASPSSIASEQTTNILHTPPTTPLRNYTPHKLIFDSVDQTSVTADIDSLPGGLKIVHLNIQSMNLVKLEQLKYQITLHKIDIITLSETWFDSCTENSLLTINNFTTFRADRERKGGGLLIFVRDNLSCLEVTTNIEFLNEVETLTIKILLPYTVPLTIITLYRKPGHVACGSDFYEKLNTLLLSVLPSDLVVLGDFNVDLKSDKVGANELLALFHKFGLAQQIHAPTRTTNTSSTCIDLIFTNKTTHIKKTGVIDISFSDHDMIYIVLKRPKIHFTPKEITTHNYKKLESDECKLDFSKTENWNSLDDTLEINSMVDSFNNIGCKILVRHCPLIKRRIKNRITSLWINGDLKRHMHHVHFLNKKIKTLDILINNKRLGIDNTKTLKFNPHRVRHKKSKNTSSRKTTLKLDLGNPAELEKLKETYRSKRNSLTSGIKKARNKYYEQKFSENLAPAEQWKLYRSIVSEHSQPMAIKCLKVENGILTTENDIASALQNAFTVVKPDPTTFLKNLHAKLKSDFTHEVNIELIKSIIQNSKVDSTQGIATVPPKVIKTYVNIFAPLLVKIFNLALISGKYPSSWKEAIVTPIYKKSGARDDPNNYRPISVLPYPSKIFEKYLSTLILNHLVDKDILLNPHQYGFRKGRSTYQAIVDLTQRIFDFLEEKCFTAVIFFDLKKAFDSISFPKLMFKLQWTFLLPDYLLKLLADYLTERSFKIRLGQYLSDSFRITGGVPQGSVLGPLLFLLYFDDLYKIIQEISSCFADDIGSPMGDKNLDTLMFRMKSHLEQVENWCIDNEMLVNWLKTKYMFFSTPQTEKLLVDSIPDTITTSSGNKIQRVQKFKYLGIWMDQKLRFDHHVRVVNGIISKKCNQLIRDKRTICKKLFPSVFKATIFSHIDYGLPIYGIASNIDILQRTVDYFLKCYNDNNYCFRRFHYTLHKKSGQVDHDPTCGRVKKREVKFSRIGPSDLNRYYNNFGIQTVLERFSFLSLTWYQMFRNTFLNDYLSLLFDLIEVQPVTRKSKRLNLVAVKRCSAFYKRSYVWRATHLYNKLPPNIKEFFVEGLNSAPHLKTWLLENRMNKFIFFK